MKAFLFIVLILSSAKALAAYSNYNSILFGEQAAGMGGAYTALTGDAAAMAFYNPAALGDIEKASISAAITVFKKFDTVYGRTDDILTAGLRSNQGFFQSIPSSSGSITKFRKFNMALSFLSPDNSTFSGEVFSDNNTTSLLTQVDESLWVGLSAGAAVSTTDFLGISLFYTARNYRRTISDKSIISGNELQIFISEKQLTSNSLVAVLGYQSAFTPNLRLGISLRTPSLRIGGSGSYHSSTFDSSTGSQSNTDYVEIEAKTLIPPSIRLGVAYTYSPKLLLSMDLIGHAAASYLDLSEEDAADKVEHRATTDVAFGMDWEALKWLKVRGGIFTNFSSHPNPEPSRRLRQPASIDQWGFSANLSFIENEHIHYTFGGYYTGGVGKSLQHIDQELKAITTNEQIFTMLVGTSYYF